MCAHLIGRRKARVAEKQFPVAHIHMRQIDRGPSGSDAFDFPAAQLQTGLKALLDGVVESRAFVANERRCVVFIFAISSLFLLSFLDAAQFYQAHARRRRQIRKKHSACLAAPANFLRNRILSVKLSYLNKQK